jgi:hypothetical protein
MEETSVSSADARTPKTSSITKSQHWRVLVDHLDKCPSFELGDEMLLMTASQYFDNLQYFYRNEGVEFQTISRASRCMQRRVVSISLQKS